MSLWVIDKREIASFVARMTGDYRVVGPVAKGRQFAFAQMISDRRYHPSACMANATRQGMPTRFLGPSPV